MDDYNISSITESKNEWCARLTNILTPCLIEGIKSVFEEAYNICIENDEEDKYLMTFQNLLNNIPKWSSEIVDSEKDRIISSSCCNYLEDLITCVHITQLKALTTTRAGLKQKKINIDIPNLSSFIHKTYISVARKVYVNVYLFEKDIMPLQIQKNNREMELIVKECILNTIRDNIPVENILKIYLDETQETDVEVIETREVVPDKEAIAKKEKEVKKKELESIKQEVKEKLEKESKTDLSKAIKKANKSFNENDKESEEKTQSKDIKSNIVKELKNLSNEDTNLSDTENISDAETDNSSEKLTFEDTNNDDVNLDLDLDIKQLDNDPDKVDLDILDLSTDIGNNENIELDIQEL